MDQNSSGNHEKGLGLWNPTYLGFNISLAIEQLCDLYLKRVESQCSLLHRGVWRMRITNENVHEGPHTQWVLGGFYNTGLPTPSPVLLLQSHQTKTLSHSNKPTRVKG